MKYITRDTVRCIFPLSKKQRDRLLTVGYAYEDISDHERFYNALNECPKCGLRDPIIKRLEDENENLRNWWDRLEARLTKIEKAVGTDEI